MASHQTLLDKKSSGVILKLGRFIPATFLYFIFTCGSCASSTVTSHLWIVAVAKIFPLLTLINYVVVRCHANIREALRCWHSRFVLLGLCFSMLGDVLLVFQDINNMYFVSGLVAFLIGHLMYIGAFAWTPLQLRPTILIKFIAAALLLYWFLWDGKLSSESIPIQIGVFAYAITLALMNWSSWAGLVYGNLVNGDWHQLLGCVGAAFFLVSDSLLAINKFRSPIQHENLLIMGTYYLAQFFIALSRSSGVILKLGKFLPTTFFYFVFTCCCSYASSTSPSHSWIVAVAKILPLLTLINYVVARCHADVREALRYCNSRFILLGLCFSLLGDVLLVFQDIDDLYFVSGLVAFLIGHLMYMGAFSWSPLQLRPTILIKFILTALLLYWFLWDGKLSSESIPIQIGVFAYAITLALMNWLSWARLMYGNLMKGKWHQLLGCVGAAFFLVSDSLLAINKFSSPIPHDNFLIMGTYYLAQFFIALSLECHEKST